MDEPYRITDRDDRNWAIVAHLSGLAGYVIPFGGAIVPIAIMIAKSERPVVASIARQALFLNLFAFFCAFLVFVLFLTILLIPVAILLAIVVGIAVVLLPIIGAIKAADGYYYRYPVVGQAPEMF
jgi:uncharacterized Tic20 family protein